VKALGARILVVDDEPGIVAAVRKNLTAHGFAVGVAATGAEAMESYAAQRPDLVLLDLGLPDMDGTQIVQEIRATSSTPIIILSVRGAEADKVRALDLGADDYLTKPFGVDELLARIRVALRHAAHPGSGSRATYRSGDLAVDLERRRVTVGQREVHLTPTEYDLLRAFVSQPDRVLTDRMILQGLGS
jgi:two-component system KDP operon response regulator KdpE